MDDKPWMMSEERFILDNRGKLTAREMAESLGRTYASVRSHIQWMGYQGRLERAQPIYGAEHWISNLRVCPSCLTPRQHFGRDGNCAVCNKRASLAEHERKMHRAYENLPQELKDRTNGTFRIERNFNLMTKSKSLKEPRKPDVVGLDRFDSGMAMEEYYIEHEKWELVRLTLDIDAVKQRKCKWLKKARQWRAERGIANE